MGLFSLKFVTSTMEAEAHKQERCIHCGMEYVYTARRKGKGSAMYLFLRGTAEERAEAAAYADAHKRLAKAADAVRCPGCDGFQPAAIRELRMSRSLTTFFAGLAITFILGIAALFLAPDGSRLPVAALVAAVATLGAMVVAGGWWFLFDPNNGRNYLKPVNAEIAGGAISMEAWQTMVAARKEEQAQAAVQAQERRVQYDARQAELREKAQQRKAEEMSKMAERAKRSIAGE